MTRFTNKPLQLLDGIYRFVGGVKGVNRIDLESDITVVHDIGRMAEKSGTGGYQGWGWANANLSTGGAATDQTVLMRDPTFRTAFGFESERYELWLYSFHFWLASGDEANFTEYCLGIVGDTANPFLAVHVGATTTTQREKLFYTDTVYPQTDVAAVNIRYGDGIQFVRPIRVMPSCGLGLVLTSAAAIDSYSTTRFWVGPWGASPPGVD